MEICKKTMDVIKFINGLISERPKNKKIHFKEMRRKVMIKWGVSDFLIKTKIKAMQELGLITLDEELPEVWDLHIFNEKPDTTKDETAAESLLDNLKG